MPVMLEYLTVEEVAEQMRTSTDTVWRLIRQKKLAAVKFSGSYRIAVDDLLEYLKKQRTIKEEDKD